jgi:hypothetical protein
MSCIVTRWWYGFAFCIVTAGGCLCLRYPCLLCV